MKAMTRHRSTSSRRRAGRAPHIQYVTSESRGVFDPHQLEHMQAMCQALEQIDEPLEAERLASRLHGRMWELRRGATTPLQPNWSFGLGAPFARELARIGGTGAKGLLLAYGHLAPPRLMRLCRELANDLGVPAPPWAEDIPTAELTRAAVSRRRPGEDEAVMIEFRRDPHQAFALAVFIKATKGGIAKHYALVKPFDAFAQLGDPDGDFSADGISFSPIAADAACERVSLAIDRADDVDPGLINVSSAKDFRALALARIRPYLDQPAAEPRPAA